MSLTPTDNARRRDGSTCLKMSIFPNPQKRAHADWPETALENDWLILLKTVAVHGMWNARFQQTHVAVDFAIALAMLPY